MNPRHTSLWIPAISIKSHSCPKGSNGYNALPNAIHNCNQSQRCTIDIFLIGLCPVSVIGNPISSLKPFLKSSSLFSHCPSHFFIPPFTRLSNLPAYMSHATYIIGTLHYYISELFPLLLRTLDLATSPHFIF